MIKAAVRSILVNAVEQDFARPQEFAGAGQLYGIDIATFPATPDGTLIPAIFGT